MNLTCSLVNNQEEIFRHRLGLYERALDRNTALIAYARRYELSTRPGRCGADLSQCPLASSAWQSVLAIRPNLCTIEVRMETQLQVWMPAILTLFGTLIVVVLTAWLNTRALSSQIESLRSELHAELKALEERIGKQLAELEPRLAKQIMELTQRIEKLEETRGLANRGS
jgi:hypothetical protein